MKRLILITLLTLIAATANATIIEIPLDCDGQYNSQDTWSSSFDFGVSFSQINDIYIDWSGQVVAGEMLSAPPMVSVFSATLYESDPYSYFGQAYVYGGEATYPTPEPFDTQSSFTDEGWSEFYDGQGNVEILLSHPGYIGTMLTPPTGQIDTAKLVINGVIVPEPVTLMLFGAGSLFVFRKGKKRNISPK